MKVCSSCQVEYEPYGQRCALCKECKRAYDRSYHAKRGDRAKTQKLKVQQEAKDRNGQYVYDYLLRNPCVECGEARVPCLQFDHIKDKYKNISDMVKDAHSLDKIIAEMAKCRVLCANCHAVHTARQFNWYARLDTTPLAERA